MAIDEVKGYQDRLQATAQSIQSVPPERVAAKDAFLVIYETLALVHKMRHEFQYAFDADYHRNLRDSLGQDLMGLTDALQNQGLTDSAFDTSDVQSAVSRLLTGGQKIESVDALLEEINSEFNVDEYTFHKVVHELERKYRHKHAAGIEAAPDSPTHSPLTNFAGFIPGELAAALQGLLGKDSVERALVNEIKPSGEKGQSVRSPVAQSSTLSPTGVTPPPAAGTTPPPKETSAPQPTEAAASPPAGATKPPLTETALLQPTEATPPPTGTTEPPLTEGNVKDLQSLLAALLIGLQGQVVKRSNTIALQQVTLALPNANLKEPKLGLFADLLALEGILGINVSGVIPDLLKTALQKKLPQLTPAELERTVQTLTPLLSQALLQLNTARVLSYLPDELKKDVVKLLQKSQLQAEAGGIAASDITVLKQRLLDFLAQQFPALSPKQKEQFGEKFLGLLLGPTLIPIKFLTDSKGTPVRDPSFVTRIPIEPSGATPTSTPSPILSGEQFLEFLNQGKVPRVLRELLASSQVSQDAIRQVLVQQINKSIQDAGVVASQALNAEEQNNLVNASEASFARTGEDLLAAQLAADQKKGNPAAASEAALLKNLSTQEGQLAGTTHLLAVLANLQRVKEAARQESLKADLRTLLSGNLTSALQQAGAQNAGVVAGQVSQALMGPEFAVAVLKKLQQQPTPAAATAAAEQKGREALVPSVAEGFIRLADVKRENIVQERRAFDTRTEESYANPQSRETNYLYVWLENQLDPATKYERRGGIQPALMEHMNQIEKETRGLYGVV